MRLPPALLLLGAAVFGIIQSTRLTRAELLSRQDTVEALEAAVRLEPENAEYRARISVLDASREDELNAALARNPLEAAWWILRSVRQEQDGDVEAAERSLLRANQVSRYYAPRWSLSSFYYRQGNREKFVTWARAALSVGFGAPESLFRMAQRLGMSPADIFTQVIPNEAQKIAPCLRVALDDDDLSTATQAAMRLVQTGESAYAAGVLDASDALFREGKLDEATELWNMTVAAGWVHASKLDPAAGKVLASETFQSDTQERGFGWRYAVVPGIARSVSDADGELQLDFSGTEPESCGILMQAVVLHPLTHYRVKMKYRLEGIPPGSGLRLFIEPFVGGETPIATAVLSLAAATSAEETFEFRAPARPLPLKLSLAYARNRGTARIEGQLWIQSIRFEVIP